MAAFFLRMVVAEGLFYLFVPRAQYREKTRTKLVDGTMREKLGRMVAVPVSPSDAQSRFILCRNDMLCAIKETLMTPSGMSRPDVSFINDWVMDPTDALELLSFEFLHYGDPDVAWLGACSRTVCLSQLLFACLNCSPVSTVRPLTLPSQLTLSGIRPG